MPEIRVKHVVTFSSEDKAFPAVNLVNSSGYKKWRSGKSGEKNAMVVLQLEVASQIHQIDIGNEASAFVEVLVGRTGMAVEDYQVILVASSFMNPMESRGNQNTNRVRIFNSDSLSQAVRDEKWDMVKVVCSQPFNKTVQYGLSFVKFYSKPEDGSETSSKSASNSKATLGAFVLKSEESGDDLTVGSLFKQKKENKEPVPLTGAAAARAASRLADEAKPSTSGDVGGSSSTPRPRTDRSHDSPGTSRSYKDRSHDSPGTSRSYKDRSHDSPSTSKTPTNKRRHSPDPDIQRSNEKVKVTGDSRTNLYKQSTSLSSVTSTSSNKSRDSVPPLKRNKTEPPKKSKEKEFRSLMEKVTFVLSGFQNPYRSDLRDKALAMGAVYKPDWGEGCTHLICAFENTPKYNQVKGKGRIVKKAWLNDCYKQQRLLPWRNYRLGRAKSPPGASDESSDEASSPLRNRSPHKASPRADSEKTKTTPEKVRAGDMNTDHSRHDSGDSTEALSDMDTDEEIERVKQKQNKKTIKESEGKLPQKKSPASSKQEQTKKSPAQRTAQPIEERDAIYDVSTDEEEVGSHDQGGGDCADNLLDMFTDKVFFLYGQFSALERRNVTRYITAYDGEIEDYMTDSVNYVITDSNWDSNFDNALADNPSLSFVRPAWIYDCHEKQKIVPHQKYVVVPQ